MSKLKIPMTRLSSQRSAVGDQQSAGWLICSPSRERMKVGMEQDKDPDGVAKVRSNDTTPGFTSVRFCFIMLGIPEGLGIRFPSPSGNPGPTGDNEAKS